MKCLTTGRKLRGHQIGMFRNRNGRLQQYPRREDAISGQIEPKGGSQEVKKVWQGKMFGQREMEISYAVPGPGRLIT